MSAMLERFQQGDVLIVSPGDGDDPDAFAMEGQRCTFVRYAHPTGHCVVKFDHRARPMHFRPADLKRETETGETEGQS